MERDIALLCSFTATLFSPFFDKTKDDRDKVIYGEIFIDILRDVVFDREPEDALEAMMHEQLKMFLGPVLITRREVLISLINRLTNAMPDIEKCKALANDILINQWHLFKDTEELEHRMMLCNLQSYMAAGIPLMNIEE